MNVRGKNNWTIIALVAVLLVMAWVIPVTAIPVADFTNATPRSGVSPLTVQFTDTSTEFVEPITYLWDFGDGGTSTAADTSHQYTAVGTYYVNLTVTDLSGGSDFENKTNYITVTPAPVQPVAAFMNTTPRSGTAPLTVFFTDQSTGTGPLTYSWIFGDGGTSTAQNPSNIYSAVGSYSVNLTVTGPGGSDFENKTNYITVSESPPVASFTPSVTSGIAPLFVTFTDHSTNTPTTWAWSFTNVTGNNTPIMWSTGQSPTHTFGVGNYSIVLNASNSAGYDISNQVTFINVSAATITPVASFTPSVTSGTAPLAVTFTDTSSNTPTTWSWSFRNVTPGNNTQIVFDTVQNPVQTFGVGNYSIVLNASNSAGYDISNQVTFINVSAATITPVASFTPSVTSGTAPLAVTFTDTSSNTPTTWSWSFRNVTPGNNTQIVFDTVQNPVQTFGVGNYSIVLDASNSAGHGISTQVTFINVTPVAPVAGFSGSPISGSKPLTVVFRDASTGVITSYAWNFGDGNTSTNPNPSHIYSATGTYSVNLTVTGPGGSDFENKTNYITVTNVTTKIGIYKDGVWNLDWYGNGGKGAGADRVDYFGLPGWLSVVGDWNGDGKTEIGVYKDGSWYLDTNGDGTFNTGDSVYSFGLATWSPVIGDWNGDGKTEIGVYKDGSWYLDTNGNGAFGSGDSVYSFGLPGWLSVVGDWNGDGKTEIGVYKDGSWYLDTNGDGTFNTGDSVYSFGLATWSPIVGDWDGDRLTEIGVYKDGVWYLDTNGDGAFGSGDSVYSFGLPVWLSVVGDWNGNGKTEIGVYKDGSWYLDTNGDGTFNTGDSVYSFGLPVWLSVVGDWNGDGKTEIGVYKGGVWYLDWNGDGAYTVGVNTSYTFRGEAGWTPVVGDWDGSGTTKIGVFKDGVWYLDWNGNGEWDTGTDKFYNIPKGDNYIPVIGDWNGNGKSKIGVYKWGFWSLDYSGVGTYSKYYTFRGSPPYEFTPVVGNWNGDATGTKIGIYKYTTGDWYLDYNGDGEWDSGSDKWYNFETTSVNPIIGDWNGDGKSKIGVFKDGTWHLDYNGDGSVIKVYSFEITGSSPIIGDWNGDGKSKIGVYNTLNGDWNLDYNGNGVWDATADKVYNIGVGTPVVGKWT